MRFGLRIGWLFSILALAVFGAALAGQSDPSAKPPHSGDEGELPKAPLCDPSSIDVTFTYSDKPAGTQTITLHLQNKGKWTCRLAGPLAPSFTVDSHSMLEIRSCWYCRTSDSPIPRGSGIDEIILAPNERALAELRWASTGKSCEWSDWTSLDFAWAPKLNLIFSPSNWPMHICSTVEGHGYRRDTVEEPTGAPESLRIAVSPDTIYNDEYATLHVEMIEPPHGEPDRETCSDLYTVSQTGSTLARLDPLPTTGSVVVPSYTPMQLTEDRERAWPSWRKAGERSCAARGDALSADAIIRADELAQVTHIEWRTARSGDKDPVFLNMATHFTVLNADSLTPNWGETVRGIRAGLSVDRFTFRLGESIPLHVRWENVNAPVSLGQGECREPWPSLEIQDGNHKIVKKTNLFPFCMGHGWGPFEIKAGVPQSTFEELGTTSGSMARRFGLAEVLPGPGVYYLVTEWTPRVLERIDPESDQARWSHAAGEMRGPYGTARSLPVRIEVRP